MPPSKTKSQMNKSTLQVPGRSSGRSLQPASPSCTQPGFIVPPKDLRTSLSVAPSPEGGSAGSLAHQSASPRPTNKKKTTPQANPAPKGKVSYLHWFQWSEWKVELTIELYVTSRIALRPANVLDHHQPLHQEEPPHRSREAERM